MHIGKFTSGLGKFHAVEYLPPAEEPDDHFPFTLTTGRLLYHYHTGTMTMKSDDLNDRAPECRVEIADADALRLGVADGEMLSIQSRRGTIQARATLTSSIMPGTVFIPFHFAAAAANRLTNAALDPVCAIPELKVCAVTLSPSKKNVDAPSA